jgi:sec-independent protein translocase protein TatC
MRLPTLTPRDPQDARMSLGEHLRELRRRVIISVAAIVAGTIVAFVFHDRLIDVLTRPYCDLPASYRGIQGRCSLIVTGILDPFNVTLKLALYAGVLLASPVWLWQLWQFVTPGLYQRERRWALSFVGISVGLFCVGGVVAYYTMENGLRFLLSFATGGISSLPSFNSYLSYVVAMILVFAVSFEFPLLVVMLNLANVVSYERLRHWTRGVLFGIFVFAAVATPSQDPFTMLALALPMCLLFGLSLVVTRVHDRRTGRDGSPYQDLSDDQLSSIDDEPVVS